MRSNKVLSDKLIDAIHTHAAKEYPRECCGVVVVKSGKRRYVPCRNDASDTSHFVINPEDLAAAEDMGEIAFIAHSHPDALPKPSDADRVSCESSGLPWVIVSYPQKVVDYCYPTGYKQPLIGREFIHGVFDCYSLIRDYYEQEKGIVLPDFERQEEWWSKGDNLYIENFRVAGFEQVDDGSLEEGDVIMMQISSPVVNHAAIYTGDGNIMQHCFGRLSSRDVYGGYWKKTTVKVVRFKGLKNA